MIKRALLIVPIFVIIGLGAAWFTRNILVAKAIIAGSEYALGADVGLRSAGVAIGAGSLTLEEYVVHNPKGFRGDDFFRIDHGIIDVATGSILDKQVRVDSIVLEGVTLSLEQINQDGNYQKILDHIKGVDFGESSESDRTYKIDRLAVRDVTVEATLELMGKKQFEKSYTLDNFEIGNVGSNSGATIGQVSATLVRAVLSRALDKAGSELPGGFGRPIQEQFKEKLDEAKDEAVDKLKDAGKSLLGGDK